MFVDIQLHKERIGKMIGKMERENQANHIIRQLPRVWTKVNSLVTQLKNTNRTFSTMDLIIERDSWIGFYNFIRDFKTNHGTWFKNNYSSWNTGLTGVMSSLQSISQSINQELQDHYWDDTTDKPVIADMITNDRLSLAQTIQGELE
jgi:hypothetical protein